MPKIVTLEPNPEYDHKSSAEYIAIKKRGSFKVPHLTAIENIRMSKGMYSIAPEKKNKAQRINVDLEDMDPEDLKVMMLSLGVKTTKVMKRPDVIRLIRSKLEGVEIVEDDGEE